MPTITGKFWSAGGTQLAGLLKIELSSGRSSVYLDQIIAQGGLEDVPSTGDVSIAPPASNLLYPQSNYDLSFYGEQNCTRVIKNVTILDTMNTLDDVF